MRKRSDGFTLVELMVVVLVIGIIVAIAVPVFGAAKTNAQKNTCQSFQRTWAGAVQMVRTEGQEPFAASAGPKQLTSGTGRSLWYDRVFPNYIKALPACPTGTLPSGAVSQYWVYDDVTGGALNGRLVACHSLSGGLSWAPSHPLYPAEDMTISIATGSDLGSGSVDLHFQRTLAVTGGTPPYTWSIIAGGAGAYSLGPTNGILGGYAPVSYVGAYTFTAKVTDTHGFSAVKTFTFKVVN